MNLKALAILAVGLFSLLLTIVDTAAKAVDLNLVCETPGSRFHYVVVIRGSDFKSSLNGTAGTYLGQYTITGNVEWLTPDQVILHGTFDTERGLIQTDDMLTLSAGHKSAELHGSVLMSCR